MSNNIKKTDVFTKIIDSNDKRLIGGIIKYLLFESEEILEKGIKISYNQISDENFFDFLRNAIYNDKVIAFELMDKNNYNYDKIYFYELAESWKSNNCINYLKKKSI
jgi:hypothetical protein